MRSPLRGEAWRRLAAARLREPAAHGALGVADLHIWPLSSTQTALAVHLVWQGDDPDAFLDHVTDELAANYRIDHVTLQLERSRCDKACDL